MTVRHQGHSAQDFLRVIERVDPEPNPEQRLLAAEQKEIHGEGARMSDHELRRRITQLTLAALAARDTRDDVLLFTSWTNRGIAGSAAAALLGRPPGAMRTAKCRATKECCVERMCDGGAACISRLGDAKTKEIIATVFAQLKKEGVVR